MDDRRGPTRPVYQPPHLRRLQGPSEDASRQGGWPSAHSNANANGFVANSNNEMNSTYGGWPSASTNTPPISGASNSRLPSQAQALFPRYGSRPGEGGTRSARAGAGMDISSFPGPSSPVSLSSEQAIPQSSISRGSEPMPGSSKTSLTSSQRTSRSAPFAIKPSGTPQISPGRYTHRPFRPDWSAPSSSTPFIPSSLTVTSMLAPGRTFPQQRDRSALESSAGDIKPIRPQEEENWAEPDKEREMEMMQSISRSGGDGAEGDALKNWKTQETYRQYIAERVESHYRKYGTPLHTPPIIFRGPAIGKGERKENGKGKELTRIGEELESLDNLVLLFRECLYWIQDDVADGIGAGQ